MISITLNATAFGITLKDANTSKLGKLMTHGEEKFVKQALVVHLKSVFQILTNVIRFTSVDTGRLRGSWTPFFAKYGADRFYKKVMNQAAPGQETDPALNDADIDAGAALGEFEDRDFTTVIGTNVEYAEHVEKKTRAIAKAMYLGAEIYRKNFGMFFRGIEKIADIPDVKLEDDEGGI